MKTWGKVRTIGALVLMLASLVVGCARPAPTSSPAATTTAAPKPATTAPATTSVPAGSSAPATTAAPKPTAAPAGPSGELRIAVATFGQEHFEIPPLVMSSFVLPYPVFDSMFMTAKGDLQPGIVERWEMAPDGLSWTYFVRKGVKFHNGDDLTAKDVKFSSEQYMRPDAGQPSTRDMVNRIEQVDDYTLRVETKGTQPYLALTQSLASPSQGLVMPKAYVEGKGWRVAAANPIGSGPFKFAKHISGDTVEYEAVPSHWRKTPDFKKLSIILMPEESTRVAAIRTGALDIAEVNPDSAPQLKASGFQVPVVDQVGVGVQLWGSFDPRAAKMPVGDIRVRKALAISINREEIMKNFFYGLGGPPMPIQTTESTLEIDAEYWKKYLTELYKYDPEEAKRLLKEAGYPERFSTATIKLYAHPISGTPWIPQLAEVIAGYWTKVGVKAEVVPIDFSALIPWRKPLADQLVGQESFMRYPGSNLAIKGLESAFGSAGVTSLLGRPNAYPQVDTLIKSIFSERNPAKRREMIAELIKIAHETFVGFQVCTAPSTLAVSPKVDISSWTLPLPTPVYSMFAADVRRK